jgi:hypothetical protein
MTLRIRENEPPPFQLEAVPITPITHILAHTAPEYRRAFACRSHNESS